MTIHLQARLIQSHLHKQTHVRSNAFDAPTIIMVFPKMVHINSVDI